MSPPLTIRDAVVADAPEMAAIYAESIARRDATLDATPPPAEAYARLLADPRHPTVVAVDAGQVVGWSRVKPWSDRAGYVTAGEVSIFVTASHFRRGLGRRLYGALFARAAAAGYHHLAARVFADHTASIALHRAMGFEPVGIQREVGRLDGRWVDVALMQRLL